MLWAHDGLRALSVLQRSVSAYIRDASRDGSLNRRTPIMTKAWTKYRTYRRTLAELRALPIDSLLDLNIDRSELATIARSEVYGC
jgi:uncharacterized protein YjiS (DUF1127 family)